MFSANTSQVSEDRLYVEDVFSTWLYTGNGNTNSQTITNGIDLSGKGGMVWIKRRDSAISHYLTDTVRGAGNQISSNTTDANSATGQYGVSFSSSGFVLGTTGVGSNNGQNISGGTFASWTFREAPKFFDVVTYTGNGSSNQTISHNLGIAPGCIIVKRTDSANGWIVYHRGTSVPNNTYLTLQTTNAATNLGADRWSVTSTSFNANDSDLGLNASGGTYVAYLFAHDTTSDGIIQCGSFDVNGSGLATVNLGWEPQWVMVKNVETTSPWAMFDNMRGMPAPSSTSLVYDVNWLLANTSAAESTGNGDFVARPLATGFEFRAEGYTASNVNGFIYIAIRRGPMRTPTSGTSVYNDVLTTGTGTNSRIVTGYGFNPDMLIFGPRSESGYNRRIWDRLRNTILYTDTTSAEASVGLYAISRADMQDGYVQGTSDASNYNQSGTTWANFGFRRAPSFFDEVCLPISSFSVNGNHNLGVAPEMIIGKRRDSTGNWFVYHTGLTGVNSQGKRNEQLLLNSDAAKTTAASDGYFVDGLTATSFETYWWPSSSGTAVLYLFASCPGVSKVGSYTGNGSSQTINCGFAAGARFVMIKRTDSTGDWYVWDSARGIVAGNDPRLSLNNTNAEVTTDDSVDTDSSGFVVNQLSATNINVSSATYIYLAVA